MREQLAGLDGDQLAFGGGDGRAAMQYQALRPHTTGVERDRPHEVRLQLEGRVALADAKRRLHCAAHRRVEERHRVSAMHDADRVVEVLGGLAFEDRSTLFE